MTHDNLINEWRNVYFEYSKHIGSKADFDDLWIATSVSIMNYWKKQCEGEVQKLWDSFAQMLISYINHYRLMNENYRRGVPKVEMKGTGGRWLP